MSIGATKAGAKAEWAKTTAIVAGTAATEGATVAVTALNAVLAINPFVLLAMAIIAVVVAVGALSKAQEKQEAKFKKMSDEMAAANFEIAQTVKKVDTLRGSIEELNKLSFLTDEQKEELDSLKEGLAEAVPEKYIVRNDKTGEVDYKASEPYLDTYQAEQKEESLGNLRELAATAVATTGLRAGKAKYGNGAGINDLEGDMEEKAVIDYYMAMYKDSLGEAYDELSEDEVASYRQFLQNSLEADAKAMLSHSDGYGWRDTEENLALSSKEFIEKNKDMVSFISNMHDELGDEELSFTDRMSKMRAMYSSANEDERKILEYEYGEILGLTETFSDSQAELMEKVGLTNTADIQKGMELYGDNLTNVIASVSAKADIFMANGMSSTQAYSMAWSDISRSAESAEQKV